VSSGAQVHFSTSQATNYFLDYYIAETHQAWTPTFNQVGEWIQVSSDHPRYWIGIVVQGRGDHASWVTSLKVAHTKNGKLWKNVDQGKVYQANNGQHPKVVILFDEVIYGRSLKLYPQTWHNNISLRFDAIYIDL
jgi:hypothetical protein